MATQLTPQFVNPEDVTATMPQDVFQQSQQLQQQRQQDIQGLPTFGETMYRATADIVGAPVDLISMGMAPFGYEQKAPFAGSEYFKQLGEQKGIISTATNPVLEMAAGLAVPDPMDIITLAKGFGGMGALALGSMKRMDEVPTEVAKQGLLERKAVQKLATGEPEGRKLYHPQRDKNYMYNPDTDTVYFESRGKWREMPNEEIRNDIKYIDKYGVSAFRDKLKKEDEAYQEMRRIEQEQYLAEQQARESGDYRGTHTAPTSDITNASGYDPTEVFGEDIYSPQAVRFFGHGDIKMDKKSIDIINSMKNNPEKEVTIYRAVPENVGDTINRGDWITINKQYAIEHGEGVLDGNYKILEEKVKAKDIFTDGNSIHEWGYDPQE